MNMEKHFVGTTNFPSYSAIPFFFFTVAATQFLEIPHLLTYMKTAAYINIHTMRHDHDIAVGLGCSFRRFHSDIISLSL